jgi:hypothetical protein
MKGPLAYYVFALVQWIFGRNMWGIHLLDILLLFSASIVLFGIVKRIVSPAIGYWTTIAFILWFGSLGWFFTAQPDRWVAICILLGAGPLVTKEPSLLLARLTICSFLVGLCTLIKPFYASFLVLPFFHIIARLRFVEKWQLAIAATVIVVAFFLPLVFCIAWFAYHGVLDDMIQVQFVYNIQLYSNVTSLRLHHITRGILNYLWNSEVSVVLPAIFLGAYTLWRESRKVGLFLITWLFIALLCVALQGKFFTYHWIPTFPPLAVLGGVGLWTLARAALKNKVNNDFRFSFYPVYAFTLIAAVLLFGKLAESPALDVARWLQYVSGKTTHDEYYASFVKGPYVAGDNIKAARYIRDRTDDADGVVVWGNEATICFLSGRENPTRFVFAMPLTRGKPGAIRSAYRLEYMNRLRESPPVYFVVGMQHGPLDKKKSLREFPELATFLRSRYRLETQIGFLELYRLLD